MEGYKPYNFLLDRDVEKLLSLFPKKRRKTVGTLGLSENASDADIVKAAWQRESIIVTANGHDFVREVTRFQKREQWTECHDLFGLIVVPSGHELQKRLLKNLRRLEAGLRYSGRAVTWADIQARNYYVRIKKSGGADIRPLPRCVYCRKLQITL